MCAGSNLINLQITHSLYQSSYYININRIYKQNIQMKENLQQSLKKIKILEDRVEQLCKVKRKNDAILKSKKLFHLSTSFTVILLLNENYELFEELLGVSLRAWETLMRLHTNYTFNLYWKKQVLAFELLALMHAQKRKYKTGLKAIYAAQTIVSELDETVERNLDYIMAVNTLTGFLLLSIQKPHEALEFIMIAERIVYKLIELHSRKQHRRGVGASANSGAAEAAPISSLEVIGESGIEEQLISHRINNEANQLASQHRAAADGHKFVGRRGSNQSEEEKVQANNKLATNSLNKNSASGLDLNAKKSCLSPTLLSNYVLGISLLKNIAMKYAYADNFSMNFDQNMAHIKQVEQSLFAMGSIDGQATDINSVHGGSVLNSEAGEDSQDQLCNGVAVSFLIRQHKIEILDNEAMDYGEMAGETFNKEFMNMLQVCIFVPFLHVETPKPQNVSKVAPLRENVVPQANLIRDVLNYRLKIGIQQKAREAEKKELQRQQDVGYQDSIAENSIVVGQQLSVDNSYDGGQGLDDSQYRDSHPIAFPIFTQAQIKAANQKNAAALTANKQQKQNKKNRSVAMSQQRVSGSIEISAGGGGGVAQLSDLNQFASMVDPRRIGGAGQQKRQAGKQSTSIQNYKSSIVSPPAVGHQRATSLQNNQNPVTPKEIKNKMKNQQNVGKRHHSPPKMSSTLQNDSNNQPWFKPNATKPDMQQTTSTQGVGGFPTLQPKRMTMTAQENQAKSQSQPGRARKAAGASSSTYQSGPKSDFALINQKPIEQVLADQRAADERMKAYQQGARQHDANIERILANNKNDWSSLYSHPKLMGQYYWKDDTIHTNKQRANEIKRVIQSGFGPIKLKSSLRDRGEVSQSLLQPLEKKGAVKAWRQM